MRPRKEASGKAKSPNYLLWGLIAVAVIAACVGGWFLYQHFNNKEQKDDGKQVQSGKISTEEHMRSDAAQNPLNAKKDPSSEVDLKGSEVSDDGLLGTGISGQQAAIGTVVGGGLLLGGKLLRDGNTAQLAEIARLKQAAEDAKAAGDESARQAAEAAKDAAEAKLRQTEAERRSSNLDDEQTQRRG